MANLLLVLVILGCNLLSVLKESMEYYEVSDSTKFKIFLGILGTISMMSGCLGCIGS